MIGITAGSSAAAITDISFFGASGLVVSVSAIADGQTPSARIHNVAEQDT